MSAVVIKRNVGTASFTAVEMPFLSAGVIAHWRHSDGGAAVAQHICLTHRA